MKSFVMTVGPNQAYETVDIHNQAGGDDKPLHDQVDEQQQTDEHVYKQQAP